KHTKVCWAFIASADQAHTHSSSGPYGYDPKAEEFDKMIYSLIEKNKIGDIVRIDKGIIDRAKPDSIWQMLILVGVLKKSKLRLNELCYECPTYFGMLIASYT
ncbi:MAG: extradiol dioxygenase, partial [Candidatus Njordarchaeota archaeon]